MPGGTTDIEQEPSAIKQPVEESIFKKLHCLAEKFAATHLGQFVIEKGDRFLRTIETTARWSLSRDQQSSNITRPMPWILFLGLIIWIRLLRFWFSLAALMIGNSPISPNDMVYFIQTRRRKLRTIRIQGLKTMREQEIDRSTTSEIGIVQKVFRALLLPICCTSRTSPAKTDLNLQMLRERWTKADVQNPHDRQLSQKRTSSKEAELDMEEDAEERKNQHLSLNELLAKYAEMTSDDDSNYEPNTEDDNSSEKRSSSEDSAVSDVEAELSGVNLENTYIIN